MDLTDNPQNYVDAFRVGLGLALVILSLIVMIAISADDPK
jgi:hypothetical protein